MQDSSTRAILMAFLMDSAGTITNPLYMRTSTEANSYFSSLELISNQLIMTGTINYESRRHLALFNFDATTGSLLYS